MVRKLATLSPRELHLSFAPSSPSSPSIFTHSPPILRALPALVTVNPCTRRANPWAAHRPVLETNPFVPASYLHLCRGIWSGRTVSVPWIVFKRRFAVGMRLVVYWDSSGCRSTCCSAARSASGTALDRGCFWSVTEDSHHSHYCSKTFRRIIFRFVELRSFEEDSRLNKKNVKSTGGTQ